MWSATMGAEPTWAMGDRIARSSSWSGMVRAILSLFPLAWPGRMMTPASQLIIDHVIDRGSVDGDEVKANRFAVELLSGLPGTTTTATNWPKAAALAEEAMLLAVERQTDPGFIILNYAYSMGPEFFAVGNAALGRLAGQPDGPNLLRRKMADALDWAKLPEDSNEFVSKMTAVQPAGLQAAV